jgi:CRISPR type III-B/RAMP module RAMP protein Cmr1
MRSPSRAPQPLPRSLSEADEVLSLEISAVTPIYRGGSRPDAIEPERPFRASAVRGLLRHWWRATRPETDPRVLWEAEASLFGTVFGGRPRASRVRVGVTGPHSQEIRKPDGVEYALWVQRDPNAKLFHDRARATLTVQAPSERAPEVRAALSAWLLLGGIGSRTRRGLGAVDAEHTTLRPAFPSIEAFAEHVRKLSPPPAARPWASLGGGSLLFGPAMQDAHEAWVAAVQTMQSLRMDTSHGQRRPRPLEFEPHRWHDDDYVEFTAGRRFTSPRAALGLPLQFQQWQRQGRWQMGPAGDRADRVPSPLHLRPVRIGEHWFPLMAVLVVPYPREIKAGTRGAAPVPGRIDPQGVQLFVDDLVKAGWAHHPLRREP